jgi:hypothetical protein
VSKVQEQFYWICALRIIDGSNVSLEVIDRSHRAQLWSADKVTEGSGTAASNIAGAASESKRREGGGGGGA